jgi:hypothetical protein
MVATSASMDLFQNLHSVLQQFLLRILAHKFPLDKHIMLVTPYEAFHLGLVLGNLYRGEIPDEWLSPVDAGGRNHSNQLSIDGYLATGFSSSSMDGLTRS